LLDSLLTSEDDSGRLCATELHADASTETVIRNSHDMSAASSIPSTSPAVSVVLPLPVQNLNQQITDLADSVLSLPVSWSGDSAMPECGTSSFMLVTTPGPLSVTNADPTFCTQTTRVAAEQQVSVSDHRLPVASTSQSSLLRHSTRQSSALVLPNGFLISVTAESPVVKTSTSKTTQFVPQTSATFHDLQSFGKMAFIRMNNGQLVHLTIPKRLNRTGANIQVRQSVSLPPSCVTSADATPQCNAVTSSLCAVSFSSSMPICSDSFPCSLLSSKLAGSCTLTTENTSQFLPNSVVPDLPHNFQLPSVPDTQPVSSNQVALDQLSTKSVSSDSVFCHHSVPKMPAGCSTLPATHDEDHPLDTTGCDTSSLLNDSIITFIPNPSCSSQE